MKWKLGSPASDGVIYFMRSDSGYYVSRARTRSGWKHQAWTPTRHLIATCDSTREAKLACWDYMREHK